MDALSEILTPYKEPVAQVTRFVTIAQMFSGSFICYDIYKQGSTKGVGIMPFVGGLIMSVLNLKFGFILRDDTMIQVNFMGLALNLIYLMVYYTYAGNKGTVWMQMGLGGAFSAALIAYSEMEDPKLVENRFGIIITAFMFYLIASPLFSLGDIIKNKSTEGMPFPIILSGTVVTFMWFLYGIILKNKFLLLQNAVVFLLCAFQLSLFVIYPSKPKEPKTEKIKVKKTN
ncbi:sugar transporter SWEET1 [Bicyclus anynana]|uniref:Sugar transporter SWEET n=1 Tax=Bicyclus anynana TaxID=110368 RepID=A0A6J1P0A4_BICAN|nr:sugar transporter SWEET1 [Bicyclus anynana]XP_023950563.1 sugar transporter SWEET1 [Bicyclus anynana]